MNTFTDEAKSLFAELCKGEWYVSYNIVPRSHLPSTWTVAKIQNGIWRRGEHADLFEAARLAREAWKE